ncbi:hypothetical protein C0Q70_03872 [Pomacea canaliculata]|uniref:Peptidase M14 domain-containing protein n=1 Tax=Pomacea canaliculata TaxID=400727 RepID=A0A2T7PTY1_POMCA|nr:hypothetical protein C0Q70_03872 [Pomacea canaliculata]
MFKKGVRYKLFHVTPTNLQELHALRDLQFLPRVDFLNYPMLNATVTLAVPPENVVQVKYHLLKNGLSFKMSDLHSLLEEEEAMLSESRKNTYALLASKSASALRHGIYLRLDEMIEKFEEGDEDAMFMLNNFTWIFIPVTNPDGYSYTWRKRAYQDYREYCENDFRGAHAFSEAETKNVRHLVGLVQPNLLAYVGIHSYAQLVIAPWGWTMERPKGSEELDRVGGLLAETMSRYGANYNFGVGETVIGYPYHGASADWVLSIVPWAYTYFFELRPDIDSFRSFVLPPSEIVPCGQEVYASFVTLSREIKDRRHLFK